MGSVGVLGAVVALPGLAVVASGAGVVPGPMGMLVALMVVLGVMGVLPGPVVMASAAGVVPVPVERLGALERLRGEIGVQRGNRPKEGGSGRWRMRRCAPMPGGRALTRADERRAPTGAGESRVLTRSAVGRA